MIREKVFNKKKWYVVIDLIRECNPSPKPSKIWSEFKKKQSVPFDTKSFEFEASNGRVYNLECAHEKEKTRIEELFSPKRKLVNGKVVLVGKASTPKSVRGFSYTAVAKQLRTIADQLEKAI